MFQTLIGILQTFLYTFGYFLNIVFQTLIGILQTYGLRMYNAKEIEFQTLIGILQTALFLALFKLLSSF